MAETLKDGRLLHRQTHEDKTMATRRTDAILALHERGTTTHAETVSSLRYLQDWAAREVVSAATDNYRECWSAERDASTAALQAVQS